MTDTRLVNLQAWERRAIAVIDRIKSDKDDELVSDLFTAHTIVVANLVFQGREQEALKCMNRHVAERFRRPIEEVLDMILGKQPQEPETLLEWAKSKLAHMEWWMDSEGPDSTDGSCNDRYDREDLEELRKLIAKADAQESSKAIQEATREG